MLRLGRGGPHTPAPALFESPELLIEPAGLLVRIGAGENPGRQLDSEAEPFEGSPNVIRMVRHAKPLLGDFRDERGFPDAGVGPHALRSLFLANSSNWDGASFGLQPGRGLLSRALSPPCRYLEIHS